MSDIPYVFLILGSQMCFFPSESKGVFSPGGAGPGPVSGAEGRLTTHVCSLSLYILLSCPACASVKYAVSQHCCLLLGNKNLPFPCPCRQILQQFLSAQFLGTWQNQDVLRHFLHCSIVHETVLRKEYLFPLFSSSDLKIGVCDLNVTVQVCTKLVPAMCASQCHSLPSVPSSF